jgi:hypothetical protein
MSYSSTNFLSRARVSSHWSEMSARLRRTSSSRFDSSWQTRERPCRVERTSPASSRTRRCLATAWRVTPAVVVSRLTDIGPWRQRRETICRRVGSPKAPKTDAEFRREAARAGLGGPLKVLLDERHLDGPSLLVRLECRRTTGGRDSVEPGLRHRQLSTASRLLEFEDDERGRLLGEV